MNYDCDLFGHWVVNDNFDCVKCGKSLDPDNDSYVIISIKQSQVLRGRK